MRTEKCEQAKDRGEVMVGVQKSETLRDTTGEKATKYPQLIITITITDTTVTIYTIETTDITAK